MTSPLLRDLPSVDRWLGSQSGQALCAEFSRAEVRAVLRSQLDRLRHEIAEGLPGLPAFDGEDFATLLRTQLLGRRRSALRSAINATGIVVHTNLGRAPLAVRAVNAIEAIARGYSNLEYRLVPGLRGSRNDHVESLITELTLAEAALVVNNCASAVLLVLATFARGYEVVVSRGELIEIGGSFRMPDVIAESGATMVEVGTTNRTSLDDYERAISERTRVLLTSHPSNYQVVGFTEKPEMRALAGLAQRKHSLCIHDLGSGCLIDLGARGLEPEPTVAQSIAAGVDLVLFSGDKLLGGPQAGIIAGRRDLIERLRKRPMSRAMRIDKLSLAGLRATLELYLPPHDPFAEIPVLRMLSLPLETLRDRTAGFVNELKARTTLEVATRKSSSFAGGGTLPMRKIPSIAVVLRHSDMPADQLAQRLRMGTPAVVTRIKDDAIVIDLRTVQQSETAALIEAIVDAAPA